VSTKLPDVYVRSFAQTSEVYPVQVANTKKGGGNASPLYDAKGLDVESPLYGGKRATSALEEDWTAFVPDRCTICAFCHFALDHERLGLVSPFMALGQFGHDPNAIPCDVFMSDNFLLNGGLKLFFGGYIKDDLDLFCAKTYLEWGTTCLSLFLLLSSFSTLTSRLDPLP